jgi:gamma-glutamyltranspeptidase/glutathione hydrolase
MWASIFERECHDGYGYVVRGRINEIGHTAVTTPGILRLFAKAHQGFGKLPWASLCGPAIAFASEGWAVRPHVAMMFGLDETSVGRMPMADKLKLTADGRALYMRPDGTPKRVGEVVRNGDLAATLRTIAAEGAESLHGGEIARRIVDDMRQHGGFLKLEDLSGFQVGEREPLKVPYRGRVVAVPPPAAGGIVVGQMLRILERFDLATMEHNSPDYIRILAEAMKIALGDKDRHVGDPAFVPVPIDRLLSDAYADACAERIRRGEKTELPRVTGESRDTTTVSCVDRDGLVVSLTHTNGVPSGVVPPGLGFMLNGAMNWYDPRPGRAGSIAPGKRRFSSMSPTIVFEDGQPVMTLGAPGGAWIGVAILQTLVNVLDFGMSMQQAVQAPRFSATTNAIDISNRIPRKTERALVAMGYEVKRSPLSYPFAAPHGITLWDGRLEGGADPQRDGYAAGVV